MAKKEIECDLLVQKPVERYPLNAFEAMKDALKNMFGAVFQAVFQGESLHSSGCANHERDERFSVSRRKDVLPEKSDQHILACFFHNSFQENTLLAAARLTEVSCGRLTALFVEDAQEKPSCKEASDAWQEGRALAEQVGARVVTAYGSDIAAQIAEYAKLSGASLIVVGRQRRCWYSFLYRRNVLRRLFMLVPHLDICVISHTTSQETADLRHLPSSLRLNGKDLIKSSAVLAGISLVAMCFDAVGMKDDSIITLYLFGVWLTSIWISDYFCGIFISLASVIAFNFLFIEPFFSLRVYESSHGVTFFVMLVLSFVTTSLTIRLKRQIQEEMQKTYRAGILLETSQKLQKVKGRDAVLEAVAQQIRKLLERSVVFYVGDAEGNLKERRFYPVDKDAPVLGDGLEGEREAALAAYRKSRKTGAYTGLFSEAHFTYLPVIYSSSVFAVIGIAVGSRRLESFEQNLILSIVNECGLALEKEAFNKARLEMEIKAQQEALRANLLRTISHDLRTPLTSISGDADILIKNFAFLDDAQKLRLCTDIYNDALWLINLIENLLFATRIENGTMQIHKTPEILAETIYESLQHLDRKAETHQIEVALQDDLLMASMDARLIMQVIINIVNNAVKYTPAGSCILLTAEQQDDEVLVQIADNGFGIADEEKKHLFERFYTGANKTGDGRRGLGLGLFLCQSIITAHGGRLWVADNQPHGTVFSFTLELAKVDCYASDGIY